MSPTAYNMVDSYVISPVQNQLANPSINIGVTSFTGTVTNIVDGDTLDVKRDNGEIERIRLSLVNTPERGELNYDKATLHTNLICPEGTTAFVNVDDGQGKTYGRIVAKVTCNNTNLNESLLDAGLAELYTSFCKQSEFARESWNDC